MRLSDVKWTRILKSIHFKIISHFKQTKNAKGISIFDSFLAFRLTICLSDPGSADTRTLHCSSRGPSEHQSRVPINIVCIVYVVCIVYSGTKEDKDAHQLYSNTFIYEVACCLMQNDVMKLCMRIFKYKRYFCITVMLNTLTTTNPVLFYGQTFPI